MQSCNPWPFKGRCANNDLASLRGQLLQALPGFHRLHETELPRKAFATAEVPGRQACPMPFLVSSSLESPLLVYSRWSTFPSLCPCRRSTILNSAGKGHERHPKSDGHNSICQIPSSLAVASRPRWHSNRIRIVPYLCDRTVC